MPNKYFATTRCGRRRKGVDLFAETREDAIDQAFAQDPGAKECRTEGAYLDPYQEVMRPNGMDTRWHRNPTR
jgi:hypothetical protein